jgi:hypothetical protein
MTVHDNKRNSASKPPCAQAKALAVWTCRASPASGNDAMSVSSTRYRSRRGGRLYRLRDSNQCPVGRPRRRNDAQKHVNRRASPSISLDVASLLLSKSALAKLTFNPANRWEDAMANFDQETLRKLHDCQEVTIRTTKHPGSPVIIWVVVSGTEVFVRSVRGAKGRWYRDLATGGAATLEFNGEQVAVQAVPTTDALSIERASQKFLLKYQSSPYAASIVRPEVLETTLRLDPQ